MKRKIIALLMATVCTTAVFASCGGGEESSSSSSSSSSEKPVCETHVDGNKDGACDECERAVVVITEQLPAEKEEEVPMVVNPLPENVKMSDYIGPKAEDAKTVLPADAKVKELEGLIDYAQNLYFIKTTTEEKVAEPTTDNKYKMICEDVYTVYDAAQDKDVYTAKSGEYYRFYYNEEFTGSHDEEENYKDTYYVDFRDEYVKVRETINEQDEEYDYQTNTTYTTKYYTYNWELITTTEYDADESVVPYGDYAYVTIDGTTYTVDLETMALVTLEGATADANMHIRRPAFNKVIGDYGYVFGANQVWVYDLTKWISCMNKFVLPSYWTNAQTMLLDNGTIFVQYEKVLHSSAVSYDILNGSEDKVKVDLVQALINPATGEITNVEFGYKLGNITPVQTEKYNDNAKNIVYLYPIEEKEVNYAAGFEAVIDSELNILYAHKTTLVGQVDQIIYLADGYYVTMVEYDEEVSVTVIVDGEGKEVVKVPNSADAVCGMLNVGKKYYSWDMSKVLLDLTPSTTELYYELVAEKEDYMILKQTTPEDPETEEEEYKVEYFYFNASMSAPAKITVENFANITAASNDYFYVTTVEVVEIDEDEDGEVDGTETIIEYVVYNANNQKIGTFENAISEITEVWDGVYKVNFMDGSQILIR